MPWQSPRRDATIIRTCSPLSWQGRGSRTSVPRPQVAPLHEGLKCRNATVIRTCLPLLWQGRSSRTSVPRPQVAPPYEGLISRYRDCTSIDLRIQPSVLEFLLAPAAASLSRGRLCNLVVSPHRSYCPVCCPAFFLVPGSTGPRRPHLFATSRLQPQLRTSDFGLRWHPPRHRLLLTFFCCLEWDGAYGAPARSFHISVSLFALGDKPSGHLPWESFLSGSLFAASRHGRRLRTSTSAAGGPPQFSCTASPPRREAPGGFFPIASRWDWLRSIA